VAACGLHADALPDDSQARHLRSLVILSGGARLNYQF
jgi:hypothetical protein